ncbi:MAG: FAD-dependent thymidylate synthase [Acidobacteria bacterium]|nr:FAD-dependent thymidylate synthase [Acidobacteriota bacterium]
MADVTVVAAELDAERDRAPQTEVFAVYGVEPEVQAYAMAKYSRSALSMRESLREISSQRAEKFLNTFYFQYGHRSIADLAHIAMAVERLSMLAAIVLVDEQRWDGQERSTRYQDFRKSGYYVPEFAGDEEGRRTYVEAAEFLFSEYEQSSEVVFRHLLSRTPQPAEMKRDSYERTLRARAFDASRYLLPLATNTSLGQIVNARTLEAQIARLLSSSYPEVRELGQRLKGAANEPACDFAREAALQIAAEVEAQNPAIAARIRSAMAREVRVAPTLVKYAEPSEFESASRDELTRAAAELMGGAAFEPAPPVDLLDESEPFEIELATTLLYAHSLYRYRQIQARVQALSQPARREIIALGVKHRGAHDELPRAFAAGQRFRFDITMDLGGFRDMHRHRRCIQVIQPFANGGLGYETPQEFVDAGLEARFQAAMRRIGEAQCRLASHPASGAAATYLSPLAHRQRALFKMDFSEAVYIAELRTTPAGHYSYRRVAWEMYRTVAERYPALGPYFRVRDIHEPVDLLKR